jgi:hypothetical protein
MCRISFLAVAVLLAAVEVQAQPAATDPTVQLQTIAVTGTQPGPGLWKVSNGEHVLWILGTVSPLPRDIEWKASDVDALIAQSQEVLTGPQLEISTNAGFFGTLALLPSLIGLRNNPDGAKLHDVLAPELYARWEALKQRYIGSGTRVEKWRPIFAALELYDAAMDKNRLTGAAYVRKSVLKSAKRAHVAITTPSVKFDIDEPRTAIKEFKSHALDDTDCMRRTLDRIDVDLTAMTARANAWATGDIAALRALPQSDQAAVCLAAISESSIARSRGMTDLDVRLAQAWFDAANTALEHNQSTLALLPMRDLLESPGYLARLAQKGYQIEAPDADEATAAPEPAAP